MSKHTQVKLSSQADSSDASSVKSINRSRRALLTGLLIAATALGLCAAPAGAPLATSAITPVSHASAAVSPRSWPCGGIPLPC